MLLCEPSATIGTTTAATIVTDELNFNQEMQFKSDDMKENYQELIEFLNKFYSNKTSESEVLDPDENDVKQLDGDLNGDAQGALSQEFEYCIYLVPNEKYQRAVKDRNASQVNKMIKSGILMNEFQLSLNLKSQITNSEDLAKCYRDCNKCVLYVSILPKNYLFIKHGSISF